MSEKIKPSHRSRKAIVYIRQSSPFQVKHYRESQRLQYGMKARICQLGWQDVEVIDEDQGRSASGSDDRCGFERLVAEVCMGGVGIVAARELSRFARNSKDWQQLIEVCRVVDTLLIDHESVYDPRNGNDRLFLGLKGSLNEYELDLLRLRSLEARKEKARRGELLVGAPIGYDKHNGRLEKTADRRIQKAIHLVFSKFLELGSARQTVYWFTDHQITLPSKQPDGQVEWQRPRYPTIMNILKNPVYAGAYVYGKTQSQQVFENGQLRKRNKRMSAQDWHVFIEDHHEGYISQDTFDRIQRMMAENINSRRVPSLGAVKRGPALLAGMLRCKRCGRKLIVGYTGRKRNALRYCCQRGYLDTGEPKCISFSGSLVDAAVAREVLRVIEPAAIDASYQAWEAFCQREDEVLKSLELELQEARYASQRAWKQYNAADPENRLVAAELERRWNHSLEQLRLLEQKCDQERRRHDATAMPDKQECLVLSDKLRLIWEHPDADVTLKKRIIRTVIEEVIVDTDSQQGFVDVVIHWKGGIHSELQVRRRKRGESLRTPENIAGIVKDLVKICTDDLIANLLNRNGLKTGRNNRWNRQRVESFRLKRSIPKGTPQRKQEQGWVNLTEAAACLGVSGLALRRAVERGEIEALHPLPDGPWIFKRHDLETSKAEAMAQAIKSRRKTAAKRYCGELSLFDSSTCHEGAV